MLLRSRIRYNYCMKNFLHHLLFPRESNNHRSKLLHHDSLLIVICLLLLATSLSAVLRNTHPDVLGVSTANISIDQMLSITNQRREEKGLRPLKLNNDLSKAAAEKAKNMFAHNYWAHVAPDGTTPWYFIKNSGYEYLYAGENLARGFTTAPDVVEAWMNSPSHRENMLSENYDEIGFAVDSGSLTGSETTLVVEMFGKRYIAGDGSELEEVALAPSPTVVVAQVLSPTPSPVVVAQSDTNNTSSTGVAAVQSEPLINSQTATRTISFALLFLFIGVLIIDAIIIERKQIVRVVSHNVDHILFLIIIALAVIIIGRGLIL